MMPLFVAISTFAQGVDHYSLALTFASQKKWPKAFEQMLEAAESGNATAQFKVASYYKQGIGTPSDCAKAIQWWEKAAANKNDSAAKYLVMAYSQWEGFRNVAKAKSWIDEALKHKDKETLLLLGDCTQWFDLQRSIAFYAEAIDSGVPEAALRLSRIYQSPANPDGAPNEYAETAKAMFFCKKAAEMGCADAQYQLSQYYASDKYGMEDMEKMQSWIVKAAENECAEAQYCIALMYFLGEAPFGQDKDRYIHWLKRAANNGYPAALTGLGWVAEYEERDMVKAARLYERGATAGDVDAMYETGRVYFNGVGVDQSYQKAFYWYALGAERNEVKCMFNYGVMLSRGPSFGVPLDLDAAEKYLVAAKAAGHPEATKQLENIKAVREFMHERKEHNKHK